MQNRPSIATFRTTAAKAGRSLICIAKGRESIEEKNSEQQQIPVKQRARPIIKTNNVLRPSVLKSNVLSLL